MYNCIYIYIYISDTCTAKNLIHVVPLKLSARVGYMYSFCWLFEEFMIENGRKFCIHIWQMIWPTSSRFDICIILHKVLAMEGHVPATVFVCIGCANALFVYSVWLFAIFNELSVGVCLYQFLPHNLSSGTIVSVPHCSIVYYIENILQNYAM